MTHARQDRKNITIKYTSREYDTIRADLISHAKRYYPNTFKDFNEASFGSLMLDTVAYVGDILSFYLDFQANEAFLGTALEYNNVLKIGRQMGYKYNPSSSSQGRLTFYITVPTKTAGSGPDPEYMPVLLAGSSFVADNGGNFTLVEDVNFAESTNEIVVALSNSETGTPLTYAIKASGVVVSGYFNETTAQIGTHQKFVVASLGDTNVAEIISVVDGSGKEYYEVEHLAQNIVYHQIKNSNFGNDAVPFLFKPMIVPRRFVLERTDEDTYLQFGGGSDAKLETIADNQFFASKLDPSKVVLQMHGKNYVSDTTFDPSMLLESDKFGIAPADTTLYIVYRADTFEASNVSVNSITNAGEIDFEFPSLTSNYSPTKLSEVQGTLEMTNDEAIIGSVPINDIDEVKERIYGTFATQDRAVTKQDYISLMYRMPSKFGAVKRAAVAQDHDSNKRNLNLYIVSESPSGALQKTNTTIKQNLKTWIEQYKMINDTVDILDANIVNFGIEFVAVADLNTNRYALLSNAVEILGEFFTVHSDIGQALYVTDIYKVLNSVPGIIDAVDVKIVRKSGGFYSNDTFNMDSHLSPDGRYITVPIDTIFELKYPKVDIKGVIK